MNFGGIKLGRTVPFTCCWNRNGYSEYRGEWPERAQPVELFFRCTRSRRETGCSRPDQSAFVHVENKLLMSCPAIILESRSRPPPLWRLRPQCCTDCCRQSTAVRRCYRRGCHLPRPMTTAGETGPLMALPKVTLWLNAPGYADLDRSGDRDPRWCRSDRNARRHVTPPDDQQPIQATTGLPDGHQSR